MSETLELAKALIAEQSVTPVDGQCQAMMIKRLEALGFVVTRLPFDDVINFWAERGTGKNVVFAGHTDVVPTGPLDKWTYHPFEPTEVDGMLYGRGAADMKGSLAAMITAVERFVQAHPDHPGSIGFLITSDEEGPSINGTVKVVQWLQENNKSIDYCIVGEPSSVKTMGDMIKNGRRGSLNGTLTLKGVQGHVAYPHLATNPIHCIAPIIAELSAKVWDEGNDYFPPTTFQVSNIHSGTGATNVIPGEVEVVFNFRFSTECTDDQLRREVESIIKKHHEDFSLQWSLSGQPFLTPKGELVAAVSHAIKSITGISTELSTTGGTSDGRFIAPMGAQVVELGPINKTIHKVDECVSIPELDALSAVFEQTLKNLLLN